MGDEACLKLSTTPCCSSSVRPPCRMTTWADVDAEVRLKVLLEPLQRGDTLGEDHRSHLAARGDADLPQIAQQPGVLGRTGVVSLAARASSRRSASISRSWAGVGREPRRRMRSRIVSSSAAGEERKALARVHGKSREAAPE